MGVFYIVTPFEDDQVDFLQSMGAALPQGLTVGRNPTPNEIRRVCAAMPNFRTKVASKKGKFWQADIQGASDPDREGYTLLNIDEFSGNEDKPHTIMFEKGSPSLILDILRRLAQECGSLIVMPDSGEVPIVVTAKASVESLLRQWPGAAEFEG